MKSGEVLIVPSSSPGGDLPSQAEPYRLRSGLNSQDWMNTVRLPRSEVVNFTRQLQVLFASGVPIARAIEVLAEQSHPANACEVFFSLQRLVLEGRYLSSALTRFPAIFSPMYIGLVKVGEQTGQLVISLALLVDWLEHEQEVLQKIRAALIYPTTVVMVAVLAAFLLVNLLAPGFLEMFARDGTPLPWPTLVVSELVKVQRQPWFWLALSAGTILMVRAARSWALNPHWRLSVWQQVIALPGLGGMLSAATWSRFCAALSILSACGVPQQRAFRSAAEVSGDPRLIIDSDLLVRSLLDGEAVWVYMHLKPELYPRLLASSLEVAGDTGQSKPVLDHLARFYREELDVRLQVLQSLIEPLLLITVSGVVLFLSLALILPLYGSLQETI